GEEGGGSGGAVAGGPSAAFEAELESTVGDVAAKFLGGVALPGHGEGCASGFQGLVETSLVTRVQLRQDTVAGGGSGHFRVNGDDGLETDTIGLVGRVVDGDDRVVDGDMEEGQVAGGQRRGGLV